MPSTIFSKKILALNIVYLIVIFGIIVNLIGINNKINKLTASENISITESQASKRQPATNQNEATVKNLKITDTGYSPAGIQIYTEETTNIKILNSGQNSHSFVIDELNIDSGLIEPGQTKEIAINKEFIEPKTYTFYSNADGDDSQIFTGVLMVLE